VATPTALRAALERALGSARPALIEVTLDSTDERSPWDFIMPRGPLAVDVA
jgi:hypothetical protein